MHHLTGCFLTGKNQIATAHWVRVAEPPPKKGYRFGRLAPKPTGTKRKKKRLVAKALLRSSWSLLSIAAARNPTIGERETPCRALLPNYFCVVASARVAANLQFSTCRRPDSTRGTVAALRCVLYIIFQLIPYWRFSLRRILSASTFFLLLVCCVDCVRSVGL